MTNYKKYLFDANEKGPFPQPDLDTFDYEMDQELFDQEEVRLSTPPTVIPKAHNRPFSKLDVGFNTAEIKNNGQFLKLSFSTKEGPIEGKVWGNGNDLEEIQRDLVPGLVYSVSGKWNEYPSGSGKFSVVIDSWLPSQTPASDLVPYVDENRAVLEKEIRYYISTLSPSVQELATSIYEETRDVFIEAPAAKGKHHYQNGGLLQHTAEVLRVAHNFLLLTENNEGEKRIDAVEDCLFYVRRLQEKAVWHDMKNLRNTNLGGRLFSNFYEKEDHMLMMSHNFLTALHKEMPKRDVVIFSVLFHDIGKIIEYSFTNQEEDKYEPFFPGMFFEHTPRSVGVSMDSNGSRLGHITLGMMYLNQAFTREGSPEGDFLLDILSCLSTHHGKKEWNSPTVPNSSNEFLVHLSDYLDAKFAGEN